MDKGVGSGGRVDVIYTDFEQASDKVPHERLTTKLKSYKIQGGPRKVKPTTILLVTFECVGKIQ